MPQAERQARNQALFRAVNELIAELSSGFEVSPEKQRFHCECSHTGCTAEVFLSAAEYAQVRADPTTYVVLPGHEEPGVEEVLVYSPGYLIVRGHPCLQSEDVPAPT